MSLVKITVLKKIVVDEYMDEYCLPMPEGADRSCPALEPGQTFYFREGEYEPVRQGFCSWAWADIQRDVQVVKTGGKQPWNKTEATVACCTDGARPVFFRIELVDDSDKPDSVTC